MFWESIMFVDDVIIRDRTSGHIVIMWHCHILVWPCVRDGLCVGLRVDGDCNIITRLCPIAISRCEGAYMDTCNTLRIKKRGKSDLQVTELASLRRLNVRL